jgi:hypothetical protein
VTKEKVVGVFVRFRAFTMELHTNRPETGTVILLFNLGRTELVLKG